MPEDDVSLFMVAKIAGFSRGILLTEHLLCSVLERLAVPALPQRFSSEKMNQIYQNI